MLIEAQGGKLKMTLSPAERDHCHRRSRQLEESYPGEEFSLDRVLFLVAYEFFLGRSDVSRPAAATEPPSVPPSTKLTLNTGLPLAAGSEARHLHATATVLVGAGAPTELAWGALKVEDANTGEDLTARLRPELHAAFVDRFVGFLLAEPLPS